MPLAADPRAHRFDPDPATRGHAPAKPRAASLSLTRRLLLALLAPLALLAAAALITYWVHATRPAMVESPGRGLAMTAMFAHAAEYGISSGGAHGLEELLRSVRAQPGVRAAAVYDRSGAMLAADGEPAVVTRESIVGTEYARVFGEGGDRLVVVAPVLATPASIPAADRPVGDVKEAGPSPARTIGWVQAEFDALAGGQDADDAARWVLFFVLGGLALAAVQAVRLARSIGEPIERLADVAGRIGAGEASVCVPVDGASPELRAVQDVFNAMACSIADSQRRMQATIEDATDRLAYQATHDPMTGLPNRRMFEQVLEEAVVASRRAADHGTLCYIDLDRFKCVNDTCGHAAGDALLCAVAALIGRHIRAQDLICRIGGDEFALILRGCSPDDARHIAEELCAAVGALRFPWEGRVFRIGASVGLARIDDPLNTPSEVLKAADTACYVAKRAGRGQVIEYCARLSL